MTESPCVVPMSRMQSSPGGYYIYFLARGSQPKPLPLLLGWGTTQDMKTNMSNINKTIATCHLQSFFHRDTSVHLFLEVRVAQNLYVLVLLSNYKEYLTFKRSITKKINIESSSGGFEQQQQQQQQQEEQEAGRVHKHPIPSCVRHKHRLLPFDRFVQHTNSPCSGLEAPHG